MESTKQRGGNRKRSGRPRKEPTVTHTFRFPAKWKSEIITTVKKWIKDLESKE